MPDHDEKPGAPTHIHLGPEKHTNWLAWLALLAGVLALLFLLTRSCTRQDTPVAAAPVGNTNEPAAASATVSTLTLPGGRTLKVAPGSTNQQVGTYLAGKDVAPHSFTLDNLNFDTAKSDIKPRYQEELGNLAQIMAAYPTAKARIAGYADARGSEPANMKLGADRANAVKAALVAKGVGADRLETASGGEHDPVGANTTPAGRAENRRTEFVITAR